MNTKSISITFLGPTVVPILQFFHLAILGPMNTKSISITFVGPINTKSDMMTILGPINTNSNMITIIGPIHTNSIKITILGPMHTKSIIITQVYHTDRSELQLSRVLTKNYSTSPRVPMGTWVSGGNPLT